MKLKVGDLITVQANTEHVYGIQLDDDKELIDFLVIHPEEESKGVIVYLGERYAPEGREALDQEYLEYLRDDGKLYEIRREKVKRICAS